MYWYYVEKQLAVAFQAAGAAQDGSFPSETVFSQVTEQGLKLGFHGGLTSEQQPCLGADGGIYLQSRSSGDTEPLSVIVVSKCIFSDSYRQLTFWSKIIRCRQSKGWRRLNYMFFCRAKSRNERS